MSFRDLFKEKLEKKYHIPGEDVESWKIEGKTVVVTLSSGVILKIKEDVELLRYAQGTLDELFREFEKEELIKRIYALESVFGGIDEQQTYEEFRNELRGLDREELVRRLREDERKYIEKHGISYRDLGDFMLTRLFVKCAERGIVDGIPTGVAYNTIPHTTQEMAEWICEYLGSRAPKRNTLPL